MVLLRLILTALIKHKKQSEHLLMPRLVVVIQLNVNILTAGVIEIKENPIDTTTDVEVRVKAKMNFTGGVDGDAVALQRFLLS